MNIRTVAGSLGPSLIRATAALPELRNETCETQTYYPRVEETPALTLEGSNDLSRNDISNLTVIATVG